MSKLAHSDHRNMARMDIERAIESGNEDCVGLGLLPAETRKREYCTHQDCRDNAIYEANGGDWYCEQHAVEAVAGAE